MGSSKWESDIVSNGRIKGAGGIIMEDSSAVGCRWEMKKKKNEGEGNFNSPVSPVSVSVSESD